MAAATSLTEMSYFEFGFAIALAALLAMGVFHHASKHGSRRATAWGVATFLVAGVVVPVYFIRYWLMRRRPG